MNILRVVQKNIFFPTLKKYNYIKSSSIIFVKQNQIKRNHFHTSHVKNKEIKFVVEDGEGEKFDVIMWPGDKLHDAMLDAGIDLECACDGEAMCSTCHCIFTSEEVFDELPIAEEEEEDMLDLAMGLTDTSRLSCQIEYQVELDGCEIKLPAETSNYY